MADRHRVRASSPLTVFVIGVPGLCHILATGVPSMAAQNSTAGEQKTVSRFAFRVSRSEFLIGWFEF